LSRGWLIVFAKAPRPGLVKTRMSPPLSFEESAALYEAILGDVLVATLRFATQLDLEAVVAFHPPEAVGELIARTPPGYRLHPQRGRDLAERMAFAACEAAAAGAERILIRGSDSPGLPLACFEQAMARLDAGDDVVLTPDQGGGYALIGLCRSEPRIFDAPMSTSAVLQQTLDCAIRLGMRVSTTQPGFDLDVVGDIQLIERMSAQERADLCPLTIQYLSESSLTCVL
jgi:rSAM/selenodomain-associated transferase 1